MDLYIYIFLFATLDKLIKIRRLILPKLKVKHRNGVKLKLDFDPRKDMSAFAYLTAKINSKQSIIINRIFIF